MGRLTQALAEHFEEVHGVDISSAMIQQARGHNRHGERCRYVVNEVDDLRIFPGDYFDFIYSNITLQHMPARYSQRYIGSLVADFHRTLARGGVFLYPPTGKSKAGKLRLLYEANPLAFLAEVAGGLATDGTQRIMEKQPKNMHERTPLILGSKAEVERVLSFVRS